MMARLKNNTSKTNRIFFIFSSIVYNFKNVWVLMVLIEIRKIAFRYQCCCVIIFCGKNSEKTYFFSTIIVAVHNSISTNEFKYDEEKTWELEKEFSKESFIQVFMPDLAKLSLSGKIVVWKKFCKLLWELPDLKQRSKRHGSYPIQCCNCKWHRIGITFFLDMT